MTYYDCFEKVPVQLLLPDTSFKGGTLDKSLFILGLGQIQYSFTHLRQHVLFSVKVSFIDCHRTALVLIYVYWLKSRSETC